MRWKAPPPYKYPEENEKRVVSKFAFLPVRCGKEMVWMEYYDSIQVYQTKSRPTKSGCLTFAKWDEIERKPKEKTHEEDYP